MVEEAMNNEEQERFDFIKSLAEQGNVDAQFYLGFTYGTGDKGVNKNEEEAAKWFKLSAEQGNEMAQFALGEIYYFGNGVEQNYSEALKWFKLSAEQGFCAGQLALGRYYFYGKGTEQNYKEAVKWYSHAAEQGDSEAQSRLAGCYYYGQGTEQNYEEALKWTMLAAEQGDEEALSNLEALKFHNFGGSINHEGRPVTKKELDELRTQVDYEYKNSALLGPHCCLTATFYTKLKTCSNISMQIEEIKMRALQGDAYAQNELGAYYTESNDYDEALKWFKLSAEQGNKDAQMNMGTLNSASKFC